METKTSELFAGQYQLSRYPLRKRETLRAWDAADEYILRHFYGHGGAEFPGRILIINDSFGALTLALAKYQPFVISDSYLSQQGTRANLHANGVAPDNVTLLNSLEVPKGDFDWVLCKVPKSHALLEEQLYKLRQHLHSETKIVAAAMARNIHNNTLRLFENIIGPTTTSLAHKKARLIFCQYDANLKPGTSPFPRQYQLEGTNYMISNHANVFSRDSLDMGTRFLLEQLPREGQYQTVVDLGCGNGVVGLMAAHHHHESELVFVDESYMAVASARENFSRAFGDERQARFIVCDCLSGMADDSVDLVLNNPPFHQQHAVGDAVAWQMFQDARRVLRSGGELWVIGNRHLGYHLKLKRLFGHCTTVAGNKKFVILKSIKQQ